MKPVAAAFSAVITLVLAWGLWYMTTPVFNFSFVESYIFVAFVIAIFGAFLGLFGNKNAMALSLVVAFLLFGGSIAIASLSSWSLFHTEAYRAQLGVEEKATLSTSLPPLQLDKAPLVSEDMAERAAEKSLATDANLGSQVNLSRPTRQIVDKKLVWVSFLQPRDFFKWLKDGHTPGYVVVDANDASNVQLVTQLHGKPLALRYTRGAFFGDDVERHLYQAGFRTVGLTDFSEELDDEGNPYYVVTLYQHTIGFNGDEATGVATVDAQTGEVKQYGINDAPAWIDRIQPAWFVKEQAQNRGYYAAGWFNPSDTDRTEVSSVDLVYAADGHADYYVGMTSLGKKSGLIGFMLVDSRTKKVKSYVLSGASEQAAIAAAEGVLPEKHYTATAALPFMLNSTPTYAMTMRDATGIARGFALVSIHDISKVVVADTLQAASRQYQMKLSQDPTSVQGSTAVTNQTLTGTVSLIGSDIRNGNTLYYFTLDSMPGRIFMVRPTCPSKSP
ncbi:MAG: hypothetical protein PW734_08265 [Verrucomicrobium sp.]|nr:hypothetical protein [Verrucomicrobium sp.]